MFFDQVGTMESLKNTFMGNNKAFCLLRERFVPSRSTALCLFVCLGLCLPSASPALAGKTTFKTKIGLMQVYADNLFMVDENPDDPKEESEEENGLTEDGEVRDQETQGGAVPGEEGTQEEAPVEEGSGDAAQNEEISNAETEANEGEATNELVDKKLSDWVRTYSPELEMKYETERLQTVSSVRFDIIRYNQYSELDDIDQLYKQTIAYELSPYTQVGADAAYSQDSSPDRGLEEESGLLLGSTVRTQQDYGAWARHSLSEYSMLDFSYKYSTESFSNSSLDDLLDRLDEEKAKEEGAKAEAEAQERGETREEEPEEEDTPSQAELRRERRESIDAKNHSASLTLTREVDWLTDSYVYANTQYLHQESKISIQDSAAFVLGIGFNLSETISLNFDAGLNYGRDQFDNRQLRLLEESPYYEIEDVAQTLDEWGPIAHARLNYQGEWTNASLNASHDVRPASGTGSLIKRTTLHLQAGHQWTEKFRVYSFASYYHNKQDGILELPPVAAEEALTFHNSIPELRDRLEQELEEYYEVDNTTYNFGLGFTYDLSRIFSLRGEYAYRINQNDVKGSEAFGNRFMLYLGTQFSTE